MSYSIGVIIGSTRAVRVGPQVTDFVLGTLKAHLARNASETSQNRDIAFDRIDLVDHALPMFDEPIIPAHIKSLDEYHHEHTKTWSRRIAKLDAFVFVTAQRNWGIPAELKNAIDYLFHEWKGKPCMIVSYGGHGGVHCAEALRTVLRGLKMQTTERMIHMTFPDADFRTTAFRGLQLGLDAANDEGPWHEHRGEIAEAYEDMMANVVVNRATESP